MSSTPSLSGYLHPTCRAVLLLCAILTAAYPIPAQDLHEAARTGNIARLGVLLDQGADANAVDGGHRTALHDAAQNGQVEAMKFLIKAGADPQLMDDKQRAPMFFARQYPDPAVSAAMVGLLTRARLEIPLESNPWTLHYAAARGSVSVGQMLIGLGADVNAVGSNGNRPLDLACLKGYVDFVKLLIAHGVKVNVRDKDGITALHNAALGGNPEVAAALLSAGAEIDPRETASGATPLYYAVSLSRTDFARFLILHGASTTVRTRTGKTILQTATDNHLTEIIDLVRR